MVSWELLTPFQIWCWRFIILIWCQGFISLIWYWGSSFYLSRSKASSRCQTLGFSLVHLRFFIQMNKWRILVHYQKSHLKCFLTFFQERNLKMHWLWTFEDLKYLTIENFEITLFMYRNIKKFVFLKEPHIVWKIGRLELKGYRKGVNRD